MKMKESKLKNKQRKKGINYYCIFNDESEQLSDKMKTIFKEYLDSMNFDIQK